MTMEKGGNLTAPLSSSFPPPFFQESTSGRPELTVAVLPKSGEIVLVEMSQRFHMDHLDKVMSVALEGCQKIYHILDKEVREHVSAAGADLGWRDST